MLKPLPPPAPFRPIRRRRHGILRSRNVVLTLLIVLVLATYLKFRSGPTDPLHDDFSDLIAQEKEPGAVFKDLAVDLDTGVRGSQRITSSEPGLIVRRSAFVVASRKTEDTAWLKRFFPQWERWIYYVDEPTAELSIPKNKGRESMVYLTFIIDNYDNLPDDVVFIHPTRFQWHNDDPDYDGLRMLRLFRLSYLRKEGYVNMRCVWVLGCPNEIKPLQQEGHHRDAVHAGEVYKKAFEDLFPQKPVPAAIGVSCCAQFAATKEKILENPKREYQRYRQWILDTDHADDISGRIFEYSWHIIFGKDPVHCPKASECYCNVFGLCDLECYKDDSCEGRYALPPYSTLPKGWPRLDWNGKPREVSTNDY
ncbi:hypothetical protein EJ05DRAFT_477026 [Pseudovirgaria hyperparasitica]|uniref:Uncharacterized protein n=1 Tax=Pseudovirgaria hyperparasitica TaxID=470096 RepID=A0A6A6W9N7_9PEZI|nr:uncharacterized protein EJ05DRAFT_477026 [Pseudovirgaria hyperparasitica]KAF2757811.1 hypothetical protein EJ05DRAFT_477026 [Pseudovirgaria hyperparasitica]